MWWISGGVPGLLQLANYYCMPSADAAWHGGMEAVVELDQWQEVLERNPANRARFLSMDRQEFLEVMDRWMLAYCPCDDSLVPGLDDADVARLDVPILVFRSGASDMSHTRATSEALAAGLPGAELVEPPWGDDEWNERRAAVEQVGVALRPLAAARPPARRLGRQDDRVRTVPERSRPMTTMTVRPIRDDLPFGARVGGVTYDGLARRRPARADQRGCSRSTGC